MHDPNKYQLYGWLFDGVHEQGGLVGYDHLAWSGNGFGGTMRTCTPAGTSTSTRSGARWISSALSEQDNLGLDDYYDYLNLGVKVTAAGCSDYPGIRSARTLRMRTRAPDNFSPDTWYAAVKRGRTFVTNGPMLALTVDDAMPGDELQVGKDAKLRIRAQAWAPESIGSPKVLEIVSHGKVIRKAESSDPEQEKLAVDFELAAGESQWIAARTTAFNTAVAHTTPVYVMVNSKSFLDRAQLQKLVANQLQALDLIEEKRLRNPEETRDWAPGVVDALRKDMQDARAKLNALRQGQ